MIELYTAATPNGHKISIALEYGLDHLQHWLAEVAQRPALIRGLAVPAPDHESSEQRAQRLQQMVIR